MKKKLDSLIGKMQVFFDRSESLEEYNNYNEYTLAEGIIRVIKKESIKEPIKPKLTLVKRIE